MSDKLKNIFGFLILGAIAFGFLGTGIGALVGNPSAVGMWASFGGGLVGAIYGSTRK